MNNKEIEEIRLLCELENDENLIDKYTTIEIYLIGILFLACLYIQLCTAYIYIIIAVIAIATAIVDYKKQKYERL